MRSALEMPLGLYVYPIIPFQKKKMNKETEPNPIYFNYEVYMRFPRMLWTNTISWFYVWISKWVQLVSQGSFPLWLKEKLKPGFPTFFFNHSPNFYQVAVMILLGIVLLSKKIFYIHTTGLMNLFSFHQVENWDSTQN